MRRIWREESIPSPRYCLANALREAYQCAEELETYPLIFKPADSRGGGCRGVSTVYSKEDIKKAFYFAQQFYEDKQVVIEEYMYGTEHSIEAIVYNDKIHILAISDKVKMDPPYRVDKCLIFPSNLLPKELEACKSVALQATKTIGIEVGAVHVEVCMTKEGPKPFELGARCGGGAIPVPIVPYISGVEMFQEVAKIHAGDQPTNLQPKNQGHHCVYRFITPNPGLIKKIRGTEELKKQKHILSFALIVKEGDTIRPVRTTGDRAGFLLAAGKNREEAIRLAEEAEMSLDFEVE